MSRVPTRYNIFSKIKKNDSQWYQDDIHLYREFHANYQHLFQGCKQVTTKGRPKFIIIEEKQLSAYKLCYAYKNQSLEVSKYMNLALITCNKLDPRG